MGGIRFGFRGGGEEGRGGPRHGGAGLAAAGDRGPVVDLRPEGRDSAGIWLCWCAVRRRVGPLGVGGGGLGWGDTNRCGTELGGKGEHFLCGGEGKNTPPGIVIEEKEKGDSSKLFRTNCNAAHTKTKLIPWKEIYIGTHLLHLKREKRLNQSIFLKSRGLCLCVRYEDTLLRSGTMWLRVLCRGLGEVRQAGRPRSRRR